MPTLKAYTQQIRRMHAVISLLMIVLLGSALCIPFASSASEEQYVLWSEIAFTAQAPAPFGAVKVFLATDPATGRLTKSTLQFSDGFVIEVPPAAFADLPSPQIHETRTTFEVGYDPQPWFYVKIPYGNPILVSNQYRWPEVAFAIQDRRVVYFSIKIPKTDGTFDWKQTELAESK